MKGNCVITQPRLVRKTSLRYDRQWQVLLFHKTMLWFKLRFYSGNNRNNPRNLFIIAQAALEPRWKPVCSWHHRDVGPRDCTEGGDKEPIEKRNEDSQPFLHQHFPAKPQVKLVRSITMIILWRDHKSVLIKNDLLLTSEWQQWIWLAISPHHLNVAMRAKAQHQ